VPVRREDLLSRFDAMSRLLTWGFKMLDDALFASHGTYR
jgi:hypothetical protein